MNEKRKKKINYTFFFLVDLERTNKKVLDLIKKIKYSIFFISLHLIFIYILRNFYPSENSSTNSDRARILS